MEAGEPGATMPYAGTLFAVLLAVLLFQPAISLRFDSPGATVRLMRSLFAALLLVFQFQPVLGTAACLLAAKPATEECEMPESPSSPLMSVLAAEPVTAHGCAFAWACAPAVLAVPSFTATGDYVEPPSTEAASTLGSRLPEASPAPPFHPPKV
jgi:hypothetical protein